MANNYSTFGFWRSWHRSYNLWIIRYIYIPLGGSRNVVLNTVLVFSFVALWHDLTFRLLAWGWLVSLFVLPELVASYILPASKVRQFFLRCLACILLFVLRSTINTRGIDTCAPSAVCSMFSWWWQLTLSALLWAQTESRSSSRNCLGRWRVCDLWFFASFVCLLVYS